MNGKLIKQGIYYHLVFDKEIVGSTHKIIADKYKLSLKNCQSIECGYDLDEMADEWVFETNGHKWSNNDNTAGDNYASFKSGFQKALEILGDKKFSEKDMINAFNFGWERRTNEKSYYQSYEDFFVPLGIPSKELQQTEWDVEIEMVKEEYIWSSPGEGFEDQTYRDWREVPKLDVDGCLILKKI